MPVDPSRLSMYAVGVTGDAASDEIRHRLEDGVHLRWVFDKSLGFPQHGFHLFRRPSRTLAETKCLRPGIDGLPAGPLRKSVLDVPEGRISSEADLFVTDEFGWRWSRAVWAVGPVAFDLAGRHGLRFELPEGSVGQTDGTAPVGAQVQIGFRTNLGVVGERIELWRRSAGNGPNPLVEKGVVFRVLDMSGTPRDHSEIEVIDRDPPLSGLAGQTTTGSPSLIEAMLPMPARIVFLRVTGMSGSIEGFAADGHSVGTRPWSFAEGSFLSPVTFQPQEPVVRVVMRGTSSLHTFTFETFDRTPAGIRVRGMRGDVEVASTLVQGLERQVIRWPFASDAPIDAIEIDGGPAVLANLCLLAHGKQGLVDGWQKLDGFPYPLGLPVTHPDYPATGKRQIDQDAAWTVARERVHYGPPDPWRADFGDLHDQLVALVKDGPSPPMAERSSLVPGKPRSPRPGPDQTMSVRRYPLDSVLLGSLHPSLAQIVGLYWVDQTAQPRLRYDYLLVADWQPTPGSEFASGDPDAVLAKLRKDGVDGIDAAIVVGRQLLPPDAPSTPEDVQCFALPGGTIEAPDGKLQRAENVTGLFWELDRTPSGQLNLAAPIFYHVWRADLGATDPGSTAPASGRYTCITLGRPFVVAGDAEDVVRENPAWPPIRMYAFDSGLPDGWYSYVVSGLDLFGRHSARSTAAEWWQWEPVPDPRPWYYQDPPGYRRLHAFAINQADRIAPPPPVAIEATALDPDDPVLLRDETYDKWFDTLAPEERQSVVGLRVSWEWPEALRNQTPDLREFRVYLQPGRLNALAGRIGEVQTAGQDSWAVINPPAADSVVGLLLQVAGREYPVLAAETGPPWRVRVQGVPKADLPCALVVPPDHPRYVDFRAARAWSERYHVVGRDEHFSPGTGPDGRPTRRYEVLLPAAGDAFRGGVGHLLAPSRADPVAYAAVGVSAADDRTEVADDPRWSAGRWGGRPGNEGAVGVAPAIFRVLRERPTAPVAVPDSERVFATRADYASRSFYTYRWRPMPHLRTHVFRALDETIFAIDRAQRFDSTGAPLANQPVLDPAKTDLFPAEPRWTGDLRAQVAKELNHLNTLADAEAAAAYYRDLSNDGLRVLAGLPGKDAAFSQLTVQPLDPDDPANANRVGPDNPADFVVDPGLRAFTDTLDGRGSNRYFYRAAYVDGAHNRSALSLSSPPVWLPIAFAPRPPLPTGVSGGDSEIVLRWASNREPELATYSVYRAPSAARADDVRSMERVAVIDVPPGPSDARPAEVEYRDSSVAVYVEYEYRLTAADGSGNASPPTGPLVARAYSTQAPSPPGGAMAVWIDNFVRVTWQAVPGVSVLVQSRESGGSWRSVGLWLAPGTAMLDGPKGSLSMQHEFRLLARDLAGRISEPGEPFPVGGS